MPRFPLQVTTVVLLLALISPPGAGAQVLRLQQHHTAAIEIMAAPGDTLTFDVLADLGAQTAAGLRFFVKVPRRDFVVLDAASSDRAMPKQALPFVPGQLFDGAMQVRNDLLSSWEPAALASDWHLLEYAALLGPDTDRARSGSGVVASFRLLCPPIPMQGSIAMYQDPIHESRLFLADGRTEKPFLLGAPVAIRVDQVTAVAPRGWARVKTDLRK